MEFMMAMRGNITEEALYRTHSEAGQVEHYWSE